MVWLTNSTRVDLVRRMLLYGADAKNIQILHESMPDRAEEIANTGHFLSNLIGGLNNFVAGVKNQGLFLHEHANLIPRWQQVSGAFKKINEGMKDNKYCPMSDDPYFRTRFNPVNIFAHSSVRKCEHPILCKK